MIIGIGIDAIETSRIKKAIEKNKFIQKNFTAKEIELFEKSSNKALFIAGNFASKEAVSKAMGTGLSGLSLIDIEVLRDESGKPYANFYGRANEIIKKIGADTIHISISNLKELVVANAICERRL